jgi:hypothetical protein
LLVAQGLEYLERYGAEAGLLREMARFAIDRDH